MVDVEEIAKKVEDLMNKILDDPEHSEQHFENLDNYLEGISDLATNPIDQGIIPLFQFSLILLRTILGLKKQQNNRFMEMDSKINNMLDRLGRIEKEFAEMKKGK